MNSTYRDHRFNVNLGLLTLQKAVLTSTDRVATAVGVGML